MARPCACKREDPGPGFVSSRVLRPIGHQEGPPGKPGKDLYNCTGCEATLAPTITPFNPPRIKK